MDFWDIVMAAATQGGGAASEPVEGNELWAQPAFDASTGVTLAGGGGYAPAAPTIAAGKLTGKLRDDGEEGVQGGTATATALESLVTGTYRVAYTIDSIGTMQVSVRLASNVSTTTRTTSGTFSEDIVISSVGNQNIQMQFAGSTDNQDAVIDNFSVKQLT